MLQRDSLLSIRDAKKSYGTTRALRGVSLDLLAGELLGFLGPNGAGKTTLIRSLAGRCKLDAGTFQLASGIREIESFGLVPQNLAIYEDLTAEQNLRVFAKLHGVAKSELAERVHAGLMWSNLTLRRGDLVKTFSGGMKRRLNIACGVLHHPRILLLDEPTVGVDPQSRERIYEMLDELRGQGTAILLATHQLDEAQQRCDRIAIVDHGQVIRVGTYDELVTQTVGRFQRLIVRFSTAPSPMVAPLQPDPSGKIGVCEICDGLTELPKILAAVHSAGQPVDHVILKGPTLQDVFLHLTGRELRE